mmetsp:Transcript_402/g.1378  ORF Transcript_402/g.1378 Transcript_402/m.1378 type:complete len:97 (-) Transcript_402:1608-1898(-)
MSSLWLPDSTTLPPWTTHILSALRTVLSLWAMTSDVRFCMSLSRASCTSFSDSVSSAEVASSRMSMGASLRTARAMATLCFCPPDSPLPRSPRNVS